MQMQMLLVPLLRLQACSAKLSMTLACLHQGVYLSRLLVGPAEVDAVAAVPPQSPQSKLCCWLD